MARNTKLGASYKRKLLEKELRSQTRQIRSWCVDINKYSKQEDTPEKFEYLNIAFRAIYGHYCKMTHIIGNHKP